MHSNFDLDPSMYLYSKTKILDMILMDLADGEKSANSNVNNT